MKPMNPALSRFAPALALAPALMLALGACATGPAPQARLDPREAKELASALEGKVPGTPVSCVTTLAGSNLRAVGDHTLVYRVNRNLTYRNDLLGACNGLRFGDTLVLRVHGSQYCRGDIAQVVNLPSGTTSGSCALGDFIPYTPAPAG